jgi:hypothetical protein
VRLQLDFRAGYTIPINNITSLCRTINCSDTVMKMLLLKAFIPTPHYKTLLYHHHPALVRSNLLRSPEALLPAGSQACGIVTCASISAVRNDRNGDDSWVSKGGVTVGKSDDRDSGR